MKRTGHDQNSPSENLNDEEQNFLKRYSLKKVTVPKEKNQDVNLTVRKVEKGFNEWQCPKYKIPKDTTRKCERLEYRDLSKVMRSKAPWWLGTRGALTKFSGQRLASLVDSTDEESNFKSERLEAGVEKNFKKIDTKLSVDVGEILSKGMELCLMDNEGSVRNPTKSSEKFSDTKVIEEKASCSKSESTSEHFWFSKTLAESENTIEENIIVEQIGNERKVSNSENTGDMAWIEERLDRVQKLLMSLEDLRLQSGCEKCQGKHMENGQPNDECDSRMDFEDKGANGGLDNIKSTISGRRLSFRCDDVINYAKELVKSASRSFQNSEQKSNAVLEAKICKCDLDVIDKEMADLYIFLQELAQRKISPTDKCQYDIIMKRVLEIRQCFSEFTKKILENSQPSFNRKSHSATDPDISTSQNTQIKKRGSLGDIGSSSHETSLGSDTKSEDDCLAAGAMFLDPPATWCSKVKEDTDLSDCNKMVFVPCFYYNPNTGECKFSEPQNKRNYHDNQQDQRRTLRDYNDEGDHNLGQQCCCGAQHPTADVVRKKCPSNLMKMLSQISLQNGTEKKNKNNLRSQERGMNGESKKNDTKMDMHTKSKLPRLQSKASRNQQISTYYDHQSNSLIGKMSQDMICQRENNSKVEYKDILESQSGAIFTPQTAYSQLSDTLQTQPQYSFLQATDCYSQHCDIVETHQNGYKLIKNESAEVNHSVTGRPSSCIPELCCCPQNQGQKENQYYLEDAKLTVCPCRSKGSGLSETDIKNIAICRSSLNSNRPSNTTILRIKAKDPGRRPSQKIQSKQNIDLERRLSLDQQHELSQEPTRQESSRKQNLGTYGKEIQDKNVLEEQSCLSLDSQCEYNQKYNHRKSLEPSEILRLESKDKLNVQPFNRSHEEFQKRPYAHQETALNKPHKRQSTKSSINLGKVKSEKQFQKKKNLDLQSLIKHELHSPENLLTPTHETKFETGSGENIECLGRQDLQQRIEPEVKSQSNMSQEFMKISTHVALNQESLSQKNFVPRKPGVQQRFGHKIATESHSNQEFKNRSVPLTLKQETQSRQNQEPSSETGQNSQKIFGQNLYSTSNQEFQEQDRQFNLKHKSPFKQSPDLQINQGPEFQSALNQEPKSSSSQEFQIVREDKEQLRKPISEQPTKDEEKALTKTSLEATRSNKSLYKEEDSDDSGRQNNKKSDIKICYNSKGSHPDDSGRQNNKKSDIKICYYNKVSHQDDSGRQNNKKSDIKICYNSKGSHPEIHTPKPTVSFKKDRSFENSEDDIENFFPNSGGEIGKQIKDEFKELCKNSLKKLSETCRTYFDKSNNATELKSKTSSKCNCTCSHFNGTLDESSELSFKKEDSSYKCAKIPIVKDEECIELLKNYEINKNYVKPISDPDNTKRVGNIEISVHQNLSSLKSFLNCNKPTKHDPSSAKPSQLDLVPSRPLQDIKICFNDESHDSVATVKSGCCGDAPKSQLCQCCCCEGVPPIEVGLGTIIQNRIRNFKLGTVYLKFTMSPNNLFHIQMATTDNEFLGCFYATEAAVMEARRTNGFKGCITLSVMEPSNSPSQVNRLVDHAFMVVQQDRKSQP